VKQRVDLLMLERSLVDSRTKAQRLIMAGRVYSAERRIEKPGDCLDISAEISVREGPRFVSRGGDKLEGALADLCVPVDGRVCADIGASTGGFTDCLLQHGARVVYTVDVGRAQLADQLRRDPRVVSREGVNARNLTASDFPESLELTVIDVSFIGLGQLAPALAAILPPGGELLALIKPQFEVGRDQARRSKGVITDPEIRAAAIQNTKAILAASGFELIASVDSRVHGPKGNIEHFVHARRVATQTPPSKAG
jgi:23S rRNA (cytidine1920-2'-O)/16S rRNA (cytidine1409-2'-O)-methyltransferase